jgi:hypothetical protein
MVNGEEKDMMKEAAKGKGPRGKGKGGRMRARYESVDTYALEKENNFVSGLLARADVSRPSLLKIASPGYSKTDVLQGAAFSSLYLNLTLPFVHTLPWCKH